MTACSPLTGGSDVTMLREIPVARLVDSWRRNFGIDVASQFRGHEAIQLYLCRKTGLRFFTPTDTAGDGELYGQLQKLDWYYLSDKWEYQEALRDLKGHSRVLEVGCGKGEFIARLLEAGCDKAKGIDLNPRAVEAATQKQLPVSNRRLEDVTGQYDAVCAFQVLEHVPDPMPFLQNMVSLLRPGGRLILAVPNGDSFVQHAHKNVLDHPPHHMLQWTRRAFASLTVLLPMRVVRVACEPLHAIHVDWYAKTQAQRMPKIAGHLFCKTALPLLKRAAWLRRCIRGHSLYVCFEKT
jgi:2-polyprenyl-3-methyl-5-hydroxy-6-metoxy-1,4-benzoquinol methylase